MIDREKYGLPPAPTEEDPWLIFWRSLLERFENWTPADLQSPKKAE